MVKLLVNDNCTFVILEIIILFILNKIHKSIEFYPLFSFFFFHNNIFDFYNVNKKSQVN